MGEGATVPVRRGRAYQELLASNSECRRPVRLPREGRRQGQAGGERRPHGAEAGRRHPTGRTASAVHRGRASAGGRGGLTARAPGAVVDGAGQGGGVRTDRWCAAWPKGARTPSSPGVTAEPIPD